MMTLERIVSWLDRTLDAASFSDVSNNGLQIERESNGAVRKVAFAVDGSVAAVEDAAASGAQLLVVHHGISWGGGIKRIAGGVGRVVRAAVKADLALYAAHLPLDANAKCGNNHELARFLGLKNLKPAFEYHGEVIGVVGTLPNGRKVGVCSGGGGMFAEEAKRLGCGLFVTGEADWGETVAAENCGMEMLCAGHYDTETFGVKALAGIMARELGIETEFIPRRAANAGAKLGKGKDCR